MSPFWLMFAFGALFSASIAFEWAPVPKDGDTIYACKGRDVTFFWNYTLSPGEELSSIQWVFHTEMIAMLSHGGFFPLPAYSGRVQQAANGGIVLSKVTTGDAGNYTVEVHVVGSAVFKHTVILHVNSGLPTLDGQLHVQQEPDAVLDSTTQQWSLVLSCGIFIYLAEPMFPVEWLTPSEKTLASTNYKDGYFHLHLANPVEDGSYTCTIPVVSACLHGKKTGQASVLVDRMEARVTLMEAEMRSLKHDKLQMEQQVTVLQSNLTQQDTVQQNKLTQQVTVLQNKLSDLTQQDTVLQNKLSDLTQKDTILQNKLTSLETTHNEDKASLTRLIHEAKTPLIGFNAQWTIDQKLSPPTHLKFNNVLYNAGQGYSSSTGDFTAPLSGAYFLIFHTRSMTGYFADSYMKVNGNEVCRVYIHSSSYNHGSCHAVVHMAAGHKAWVEPIGSDMYYNYYTTSFAGFLFYADP